MKAEREKAKQEQERCSSVNRADITDLNNGIGCALPFRSSFESATCSGQDPYHPIALNWGSEKRGAECLARDEYFPN
jgi:hypothetical protein